MSPFDSISNTQIKWWIGEYVHNQRDRALLLRRLCDGICFEPLSEEFDLSVRQTKTIVYREQDRLLKYYEA